MLTDLNDIADQVAKGGGRGGKRPNTGRPRKDGKPKKGTTPAETSAEVRTPEELLTDGPPPPMVPADETGESLDAGGIDLKLLENPSVVYATAKARKESADAAMKELNYRIKAGQYLPREAVRTALAEVFQSVAQSLRSIPDNLERKLGLKPDVAEMVSATIDEIMGELAVSLERIHTENAGIPKD